MSDYGKLKALIDNAMQSLDNATPCYVTGFIQDGSLEPSVSVVPSINRKLFIEGRDQAYEDRLEIFGVRLSYHSTNNVAITLPVKAGDRGWLVAMDENLDLWDTLGEIIANPNDASFKEFGNACIFVPGLYPEPLGFGEYSQDNIEIRTNDNLNKVSVGDAGINIISNVAVNINTPLLTHNGLPIVTVNPSVGGTPVPPVIPILPSENNR